METTEAAHALFSASGADGWMNCAPKLAAERGIADTPSRYAAEGTAAHQLASWTLEEGLKGLPALCANYLGQVIKADGFEFTVDEDMAGHVQTYVDAVYQHIAEFKLRGAVGVTLLVEVRVDYSRFIGQPNSFGTSDVVMLVEWPGDVWQIDVGDLKYGMGVHVDAYTTLGGPTEQREGNKQMMLYSIGALDQYSTVCGEVSLFSMTIYQPRLNHISTYECDLVEVLAFADRVRTAAMKSYFWLSPANTRKPATKDFTPGEKQCRWCCIGGSCRARAEKNLATVAGDFLDLDALDADGIKRGIQRDEKEMPAYPTLDIDMLYPSLDEIDKWVKAVRGEIEKRALAGHTFTTCKLVQGKRGNRAWTDEAEAEKALKAMRLKKDEMYSYKLISPTVAEKLLKTTPKRWAKVTDLIGQADGKLSVADINDKRPAIVVTPPADDFEALDDGSDLA